MWKTIWTVAALLTICDLAPAQQPSEIPTVVLRLVPGAEPVPAMRYRLLPELREQSPGNAVLLYYRAYSPEWQSYRREKGWDEKLAKALEGPLEPATFRDSAWVRQSAMLREVDRGARRSHCDWELKDRLREEGIGLLLPDAQGLRQFANLLALRTRMELADRDFDKACQTLKTGYALSRHTGEGPTLIHGLIGIAMASVMNKQVETWVQQPGAPNLYWALTDMPVSFVNLRNCLQGERMIIDSLVPNLRERIYDPKAAPMTADQIRQVLKSIEGLADGDGSKGPLLGIMMGTVKYPAAKKFLASRGWTPEQIEAVPVLQAVLMHETFEYDRCFDAMSKAANLPYDQCREFFNRADDELKQIARGPNPMTAPILARLLLPAVSKVFQARARLDRHIALLRVIEAIRMYAAANQGKLPDTLAAITIVPVPVDPKTGKAFDYRVEGDKAILTAAPLPNEGVHQGARYELTIAK